MQRVYTAADWAHTVQIPEHNTFCINNLPVAGRLNQDHHFLKNFFRKIKQKNVF